jgi:hypothetical protein
MPQETNLNRTPYFDDFDPNKDFHKVLFKPGYSVQARELTTLQSILQNQIEKFGNHFFKEGSRVIPGAVTYSFNYRSVQIENEFLGLPVSLYKQELIGKRIRGSVSGVSAKITNVEDNTDNGNIILFIDYEESGNNFSDSIFINGENLVTLSDITFGISNIITTGEEFAKTINSNSTSIGSAVFISEGIYFTRGYFVRVASQTLVLDAFNNAPSYRVGLLVNEEIVTADQDPSLYDNSRGFSNYAAPGADRFKISASLSKKSVEDFNDENFIELLRVTNGVVERIVDKTEYSIIADELARRTFDESGDYYITPFDVYPRETLNDRLGNNGLFYENQITANGNVPSDNLLTYKISPGKAYIRGFEVNKDNQTFIDIDKPRTTANVQSEGISFNTGPIVFVTNSIGQPSVGIATTSYLSLRDSRLGTDKTIPAGNEIGVARAYDYKIANSSGITTSYELRIFDVQTFTNVGLSASITAERSSLIVGKTSGARGYLKSAATNTSSLTLYDVSGRFVKDEAIIVSGITTFGQTVKSIRDYKLSDVNSIYSYRQSATNNVGFNADMLLDIENRPTLNIPNSATSLTVPSFTISAKDPSTGISTVTSTTTNFVGVATVGNIVSYAKPGSSLLTYNQIQTVSNDGKSIGITSVTSVDGICDGSTSSAQINTSEFSIRSSKIVNTSDNSFTTKLSEINISTIDTENTDITLKRQYNIASFSGNVITAPTLDTDYIYEPYSQARYTLTYSNGVIENLTEDKFKFSNGFKNLEIRNLSVSSGSNATLLVTLKKGKVKEKIKKLNKANTIVISRSNNSASGTGNVTLNDGLTYSSVYGTRVQDDEISLNVPDAARLLGVFESLDIADPSLPTLVFATGALNGPNNTATDILVGDTVIGSESNAVAIVISRSTLSVEIVYRNNQRFIPGEVVSFKESIISGPCSNVTIGDKDVTSKYSLDDGQREYYYDFSRIIKKDPTFNPTKKIKVVFQNYYVDSSDVGDVFTVDSYPTEEFSKVPYLNNKRLTDLVDIRPRVSSYNSSSTLSPFEFGSRNFNGLGQSSSYQIAPNETFLVSFSYYLPRIDKLFLSKEGNFQLQKGIPSKVPTAPKNVDGMLEIATISLPAYLYNIKDALISYASHKRYRMQDISRLESRIANLEYYTQLSLLETATDSLSIKTNGLDRFKCGFFVDNFKSHNSHDTLNPLFRCSIDKSKGYLRPSHFTTAIDLIGQSSIIGIGTTTDINIDYRFEDSFQDQNVKKNKKILTLSYTDTVFVRNPFATRVESVTPFLVKSYTGTIELNPSSDTWVDTRVIEPNRVVVEGSYQSTIQQLDVNPITGFSAIDWGAWQTDWIGVDVSSSLSLSTDENAVISSSSQNFRVDSQVREENPTGGRDFRRPGTRTTTGTRVTTTTGDRIDVSGSTSVTTSLRQSREGIRWNVTEQVDSQMLGQRIVNNEFIRFMRARNIEFTGRKLKPFTQMYAFFDNVDVTPFCFPKLLEIRMVSGTFQVGETVNCIDPQNSGQITGYFRVAQSNHKYGPYNAPTDIYTVNPYSANRETIQSAYTSSSSILNVDTASMEEAAIGNFHGRVQRNSILVGQTSGARAEISDFRLITDNVGTLIGSFFVPGMGQVRFETGIKNFKLTNIQNNTPIPGSVSSSAEEDFYAQGLLQTSQDTNLGVRNARVRRETFTGNRTLSASDTSTASSSTFINIETNVREENVRQTEAYYDPLAQSFIVSEPNGIFVTKVDLFFFAKANSDIPVVVQIRPVKLGVPSTEILPFSEIEVLPGQITTSDNGSVATTVTFDAPVFLENGKEYAIVLLSDSTEYQVWISRMGEEDRAVTGPEAVKRIVSQQPTLGSLFKSQNASTWEPSGFEDLKFTLYKAQFTSTPGSFSFYNPVEGGSFNTLSRLNPETITSLSNKVKIGLSTSILSYSGIRPGVSIGITDRTFSGNLIGIAGSVSTGFALTSSNIGSGYTASTYLNVPLQTITGEGSGLTVDITFDNGALDLSTTGIVTVTDGGYGYRVGDIVGIPTSVSFGSGAQLSVTSIGSFNTLIIDNVQGNYDNVIGKRVTYEPLATSGISSYVGLATVSYIEQDSNFDGLHLKVNNFNHGMYSTNNLVRINNMKSDLKPAKLTSDITSSSTANIELDSIAIFANFENVGVSSTNPGYVRIENELISYTGVSTASNLLTGITRGVDANLLGTGVEGAVQHNAGDLVFKYEFNNVSLRRINRIHNMSLPLASVPNPIDIDNYYLKLDMSDTTCGVDRSGNVDGLPDLFFGETKSGSNFNYAPEDYITSSKNIVFSSITPNVNAFTPKGTAIGSRIRTVTATSVDGSETSFVDNGFESIQLNNVNNLSSLRLISSKDNEDSKLTDLPGNKSFTMTLDLFTADTNVSPVIDMERVNMILTSNRVNNPISSWPDTTSSTRNSSDDPNSAIYVSNIINLANSATSLKVLFSAYRPNSSDIKVMYRIFRKDIVDNNPPYEFFPGYANIDSNGNVINPLSNNGDPDVFVEPSTVENDFKDYEFSIDKLPEFSGFSIKIIMTGTDQSRVPLIKELRTIALA